MSELTALTGFLMSLAYCFKAADGLLKTVTGLIQTLRKRGGRN